MIKVDTFKENAFLIELMPNHSLSGFQRIAFFIILFGTCLVIGIFFFFMGATLVLPFAGLEIMLVSIGFYLNFKWSRQKELISISPELVKVEKGSLIKNFEWEEFRAFVKLDVQYKDKSKDLYFVSKGKKIKIGDFLNNDEKDSLITELTDIIQKLNAIVPG